VLQPSSLSPSFTHYLPCSRGRTALHGSAQGGSLEICRLLVESKADVAARDRCFSPPPSHNLLLTICLAERVRLHSIKPSYTTKPLKPTSKHTCACCCTRRNDALPRPAPAKKKIPPNKKQSLFVSPLLKKIQPKVGDEYCNLITERLLLGPWLKSVVIGWGGGCRGGGHMLPIKLVGNKSISELIAKFIRTYVYVPRKLRLNVHGIPVRNASVRCNSGPFRPMFSSPTCTFKMNGFIRRD
jgi:hypothetical protein